MQIHGINRNGWRMNWWKVGRSQWLFIVWPREKTADGTFVKEHPMWRPEKERPTPHYQCIVLSRAKCEALSERDWTRVP